MNCFCFFCNGRGFPNKAEKSQQQTTINLSICCVCACVCVVREGYCASHGIIECLSECKSNNSCSISLIYDAYILLKVRTSYTELFVGPKQTVYIGLWFVISQSIDCISNFMRCSVAHAISHYAHKYIVIIASTIQTDEESKKMVSLVHRYQHAIYRFEINTKCI